jgi:hypothetical protein
LPDMSSVLRLSVFVDLHWMNWLAVTINIIAPTTIVVLGKYSFMMFGEY